MPEMPKFLPGDKVAIRASYPNSPKFVVAYQRGDVVVVSFYADETAYYVWPALYELKTTSVTKSEIDKRRSINEWVK